MPILSTENWLNYYSTLMGKSLQTATIQIPISENCFMRSNAVTTTGNGSIFVGETNAATGAISRAWILPDFSSIPPDVTITAAQLKMTPIADTSSNDRTMSAARCLRAVNPVQCTWNVSSTGNNWGTGGGSNSTTDYDGANILGTALQPDNPTLNDALSFVMNLSPVETQKLYDGTYVNNGILLFVDTQLNDRIQYADKGHATAGFRPVIEITYEWFG